MTKPKGGYKPPKWAKQAKATADQNKAKAEAEPMNNDHQQWTDNNVVVHQPQPTPTDRGLPYHRPLNTMTAYTIPKAFDRLQREGFDKRVTALTYDGYIIAWLKYHDRSIEPRRVLEKGEYTGPAGHIKRNMTMASFIMRPKFSSAVSKRMFISGAADRLVRLFNVVDIAELWEALFAQGLRSAQSAAQTSLAMWSRISSNIMLWNTVDRAYHYEGKSGVFVVVSPEYMAGDVLGARDLDPHGKLSWNVATNWWKDVIIQENELFEALVAAKSQLSNDKTPAKRRAIQTQLGEKATFILEHLNEDNTYWHLRQFASGRDGEKVQFLQITQGQELQHLIKEIWKKHSIIKVLYFEGTALLDRRVLAVILRGCPNLTMLGVYACELLHFADVITLLDLIGEINIERREQGHPEIKALDFGPNYEPGMSCQGPGAETWGITWEPFSRDTFQMGYFAIIAKAFFKAQSLGIGLLFDEGCAFRNFLDKVPTMPFGVPMFLDALYRLLDLNGQYFPHNQFKRKQAIYDLRIVIHMILGGKFHKDTDQLYHGGLQHKAFCTSCGYDMLDDFFTWRGRDLAPLTDRSCAGCRLSVELDSQNHRVMAEKRACLDTLFPDNDPKSFNLDADIHKAGQCIINLRSTNSGGPPPGAIRDIPYRRDKKLNFNGLSGLPTLAELAADHGHKDVWVDFRTKLSHVDAFCLAARIFEYQRSGHREERDFKDFKVVEEQTGYCVFLGPPNHYLSRQGPRFENHKNGSAATFSDALFIHMEWVKKGILPSTPDKLFEKGRKEAHKAKWEKDFW